MQLQVYIQYVLKMCKGHSDKYCGTEEYDLWYFNSRTNKCLNLGCLWYLGYNTFLCIYVCFIWLTLFLFISSLVTLELEIEKTTNNLFKLFSNRNYYSINKRGNGEKGIWAIIPVLKVDCRMFWLASHIFPRDFFFSDKNTT